MNFNVGLDREPLCLNRLLAEFANPAHGAQTMFTGRVRNHNQGKVVRGVSYDAYDPLAENIFRQICEEAASRWGPDLQMTLRHRLGRLNIGDLSVAILVSSRHRDESFQACRYLIEELKHRAVIWKQEHYENGDSEWLAGHALCGHPEVRA